MYIKTEDFQRNNREFSNLLGRIELLESQLLRRVLTYPDNCLDRNDAKEKLSLMESELRYLQKEK